MGQRILLVNPAWMQRGSHIWKDVASVMPPIGLALVAGVLEAAGHQVSLLDAHAERVPVDRLGERLAGAGPFDLIGLTATTVVFSHALEFAAELKRLYPAARFVLGGVHATVMTDDVFASPVIDFAVRGEGEITMRELAGGRPPADIEGLSHRTGERVIHNPERPLLRDLDQLPLPAYHLLPMARYYPAVGAYRRLPAISLMASRGCPGRCTFCYRLFGNTVRVRSARRVAEEIRLLQQQYGIREICFYDDTFTSFRENVLEFCRILTEERFDLSWSCFSRADFVDAEMLARMARAGCHQIMFGAESSDAEVLRRMNKRADMQRTIQAVRWAQQARLDVRAAFMFGSPGETLATLRETLRFAMRLDPEIVVFNTTTPYPGTEMFDWAHRNGLITTYDWDDYDLSRAIMNLPGLPAERVTAFIPHAYHRFYLRPRYVWKMLRSIRTWNDLLSRWHGFRAVVRTRREARSA